MQRDTAFPRLEYSCPLAARALTCATLALSMCHVAVRAQAPDPAALEARVSLPDAPLPRAAEPNEPPQTDEVSLRNSPRNILHDQGAIWTSPARLRPHDLEWLAPLALATGAAVATDHRAMTQVVSRNPDFNQANINTSNGLIGAWIAAPVALYGFGHFKQDDYAREAGILSGEAMLDGVVVEQGMKLIFWRERPSVDNARGRFFQSSVGVDSSFPSSHSLIAWCAASALASEYPSHWAQFALYSAAASVSLTRVMGQEHFPSDVLVGSATGWLIGHYVVRRHHHRLLSELVAHR